ncbi:MAG: KH domain-containing protein [Herpetosiphon sp.]
MRSIEISARTVAEAARLALEQLGVDEDDAIISVLQPGDEENEALVRVSVEDQTPPAPVAPRRPRKPFVPEEAGAHARQVMEGMLEHMGLEGYVNVHLITEVGPNDEEQQGIQIDIEGLDEETVGLMIGRRGETLRSLQFLLNTIVHHASGRWPQIVLDVGNYRERRKESLESLARRAVDQVRQSGRPLPLEPMQSYDRRIIHMALRDHEAVYTESNGEGEHRRIIVHPRRP